MSIRLHLFGSPKVDFAGESFVLPFERRSQLLALLALKRAWVGRAELAAMFWPDQADEARVRQPAQDPVPPAGAAVGAAASSRRAAPCASWPRPTCPTSKRRLRDGASPTRSRCAHGELLAGFDDGQSEAWTSWLGFERDRLRAAWRGAALARLAADIDPGEGIELSARLLESDPLDEAALRAHMLWLARARAERPRAPGVPGVRRSPGRPTWASRRAPS